MSLDTDVSKLPPETQFIHAQLRVSSEEMTSEQLREALLALSATYLNYKHYVNGLLRKGLERGIPML